MIGAEQEADKLIVAAKRLTKRAATRPRRTSASGGSRVKKPLDGLRKRMNRKQIKPLSRRNKRKGMQTKRSHQRSYKQAYQEGFNQGFAKGFEDGHQLAYAGQV